MRAKDTSLVVCRVAALLCLQEGNFRLRGYPTATQAGSIRAKPDQQVLQPIPKLAQRLIAGILVSGGLQTNQSHDARIPSAPPQPRRNARLPEVPKGQPANCAPDFER